VPDTPWGMITWHGADPTGTNILVIVRSSNDRSRWSAWETAPNAGPLAATPAGRYLEIQVILRALENQSNPVLYDLAVAPASALPPPLLIQRIGPEEVALSWPGYFEGFGLESAETPWRDGRWQPVLPPPALKGGRLVVTNKVSGPAQWYRLRQ